MNMAREQLNSSQPSQPSLYLLFFFNWNRETKYLKDFLLIIFILMQLLIFHFLAQANPLAGLDIQNLLSNPAVMNMAQNFMQNPAMQNM